MDLSFWFKSEDEFRISRVVNSDDDSLIVNTANSPVAYTIQNASDNSFSPFIRQIFNYHNVYRDIQSDDFHIPKDQQIIDYCRLLKFRYQLINYRQNFYSSLALSTVLAYPILLKHLNAGVKFVDLDTFKEKMDEPEHGISDQNLYIAYLKNRPEGKTLKQLLFPLLQNRGLRNNQIKTFIESSVRSGMGDIRETSVHFFKSSHTHRTLNQAKIFTFQAILRNGFVHNYTFNMKPHYLNKLPLTWRGYTIDANLNNQPMSGQHFPVPEFIILIDDIIELIDVNIKLFPQIEITSPYIN